MNQPKGLSFLQSVPEKVTAIFVEFHVELDKARKTAMVYVGAPPDEIRKAESKSAELQRKAKEDALTKLTELLSQVNSQEKRAQKDIDLELGFRVDSSDTQENLLREMRENSAWQRIKPILDREDVFSVSNALSGLIKDFALASDKDSISVIRKELPMYVRARFPKDDILSEAIDAFERALSDTLPEAVEALRYQSDLRTGVYQLRTAINYAEYAIKKDELEFPMPVWEQGKTEIVTTKGASAANYKNSAQL